MAAFGFTIPRLPGESTLAQGFSTARYLAKLQILKRLQENVHKSDRITQPNFLSRMRGNSGAVLKFSRLSMEAAGPWYDGSSGNKFG